MVRCPLHSTGSTVEHFSETYQLLHKLLGLQVIMFTASAVIDSFQHRPGLHDSPQHKEVREVHVLNAFFDSCVAQPGHKFRQALPPDLALLI